MPFEVTLFSHAEQADGLSNHAYMLMCIIAHESCIYNAKFGSLSKCF